MTATKARPRRKAPWRIRPAWAAAAAVLGYLLGWATAAFTVAAATGGWITP